MTDSSYPALIITAGREAQYRERAPLFLHERELQLAAVRDRRGRARRALWGRLPLLRRAQASARV